MYILTFEKKQDFKYFIYYLKLHKFRKKRRLWTKNHETHHTIIRDILKAIKYISMSYYN